MTQRNNIFAGCSVLIALGAVGVGVVVSSNAMAASAGSADEAVTIGMVTIGDDGSAFECTFDADELPAFAPSFQETGGPAVGGSATAGGGVVSSSGSIVAEDGVPVDLGELQATGTASPGDDLGAFQVLADGELQPIEVRQGTEAECTAALDAHP